MDIGYVELLISSLLQEQSRSARNVKPNQLDPYWGAHSTLTNSMLSMILGGMNSSKWYHQLILQAPSPPF